MRSTNFYWKHTQGTIHQWDWKNEKIIRFLILSKSRETPKKTA